MPGTTECRRCGECLGCRHHWLDRAVYEETDPDKHCKHCPAIGRTCEACDGDGFLEGVDGDGGDYSEDCPACEGWGVVEVGRETEVN